MTTFAKIGWLVSAGFCWLIFLFCSFKLRQTSGKEFVNDVYTDLGAGSFSSSIANPIKKFFWGSLSAVTFIAASVISLTAFVNFDDKSTSNKVENSVKKSDSPGQSVPLKDEAHQTNKVQSPSESIAEKADPEAGAKDNSKSNSNEE